MTDLKRALGTLDQLKVPDLRSDALMRRPGPMVEVGRHGSAKRVRAGILAVVISIVAAAFAWSAFRPQSAPRDLVPGSPGAGVWPAVIHSSHDPASRPVSEACPVIRAELTVSPKTAVPGTTVTVSGPLYHLDEAGNFLWYADQQPGEDLQGWWNLDPEESASVATEGLAIASGEPYEPSGMGPQMLGDDVPNGACGFSLSFVVPDVAAGSYPVSVVEVGGESSTAYGSFVFTVMQSSS